MQLFPVPIGLKERCPKETTIQVVFLKQAEGKTTIVKQFSFPEKIKRPFPKRIAFGHPYKPQLTATKRRGGRNIWQYCLENLGGRALACYDLTLQVARRAASKPNILFEDKHDEEIDPGCDHITHI